MEHSRVARPQQRKLPAEALICPCARCNDPTAREATVRSRRQVTRHVANFGLAEHVFCQCMRCRGTQRTPRGESRRHQRSYGICPPGHFGTAAEVQRAPKPSKIRSQATSDDIAALEIPPDDHEEEPSADDRPSPDWSMEPEDLFARHASQDGPRGEDDGACAGDLEAQLTDHRLVSCLPATWVDVGNSVVLPVQVRLFSRSHEKGQSVQAIFDALEVQQAHRLPNTAITTILGVLTRCFLDLPRRK